MSEPALNVGDRLDKYVLVEKLGEGGMGVVFGAVHEALGREVAVKLLRAQYAQNEELLLRFQREAESVSRIGHPNIVAVYDFGRTPDGSLYYVMERIRGETLRTRLNSGPALTDEELLAIWGPMCRALGAAHARGIVHRDLKPDNILLQAQQGALPHVKVVDFGVAKVLETSANVTRAGSLIGTPTYMAPEQIAAAQDVDGRADVYSLGAMLYAAIAGRPPFIGDPMAVLMGHIREPVPPPSTVNPIRVVTPALEAMVMRTLSKDPAGRPPDTATFYAELEAALGGAAKKSYAVTIAGDLQSLTGQASLRPPIVAQPSGSGSSRLVAIVGGAVILIGAAIAGVVLLRGSPPPSPAPAVSAPSPAAAPSPSPAVHDGASRASALVEAAYRGQAQDRRAVLDALAELGDARARALVLRGLADDNPEVRRAAAIAASAVGRAGDSALTEALTEAAGRSGGAVAVEIAAARLRLGDVSVVELLTRALDGGDATLRLRAAVALGEKKLVTPARLRAAVVAAPPTVRRSLRWSAYLELHRLGDAPFEAELTRALTGSDLVAKLDAAIALVRAADPRARAALADVAEHATDAGDRIEAQAALAELGDEPSFAALVAATRASAPSERARTAIALGRLGRQAARAQAVHAALSPLVDDLDRAPRLAAAAALTVLSIEEAKEPK